AAAAGAVVRADEVGPVQHGEDLPARVDDLDGDVADPRVVDARGELDGGDVRDRGAGEVEGGAGHGGEGAVVAVVGDVHVRRHRHRLRHRAAAADAAEGDVVHLGPLRGEGGPDHDARDLAPGEAAEGRGRAGDRRRAEHVAAGVEGLDRRRVPDVVEVEVEADRVHGRVELHDEVLVVEVVTDPPRVRVEAAHVRDEDV